ncbi:16S rRNA (cytosine(967)-C(5))-methyltransferase RsmB [Thermosulfuriphilus sp.]
MFSIARQLALKVLVRFEKTTVPLDDLLSNALKKAPGLEGRDRNLVMELVYGTVRYRASLDWLIDTYSQKPRHRLETSVVCALRLGIYQVLYTRIPDRAAVNETVNLLKDRPSYVSGFVNAILRRICREKDQLPWPKKDRDLSIYLAVRYSYPPFLVRRWLNLLGTEETEALLAASNKIPPLSLRTNTLRLSRQQLATFLKKEAEEVKLCDYAPEGLILRRPRRPVTDLTGFKQGWFQVQDEASQLVGHLLFPRPGEKILDACAGVGGKTTHLAQLMKNMGQIQGVDIDQRRLRLLKENLHRLGISNVTIINQDVTQSLKELKAAIYDRILVDAPCTGTGVIRRHPDIKWRRSPEDLEIMPQRQRRLLEAVAPLLKPGGCLVYAVCSLEPEEGEELIESFLADHPDFHLERPTSFPAFDLLDERGFFRTMPHRQGMDGFFAAVLKKA